MIKVKGHTELRRDPNTGSIVNIDMESYKKYQEKVQRYQEHEKRIDKLEDKIDTITELLTDLLNKNN